MNATVRRLWMTAFTKWHRLPAKGQRHVKELYQTSTLHPGIQLLHNAETTTNNVVPPFSFRVLFSFLLTAIQSYLLFIFSRPFLLFVTRLCCHHLLSSSDVCNLASLFPFQTLLMIFCHHRLYVIATKLLAANVWAQLLPPFVLVWDKVVSLLHYKQNTDQWFPTFRWCLWPLQAIHWIK